MGIEVVHVMFFPLFAVSALCLFLLRKKEIAVLFAILLYSVLIREICRYTSARYFCIFIFFGCFIISLSIKELNKQYLRLLLYGLLSTVIIAQPVIAFSSFENKSVLDLQETAKRISDSSRNNFLYIYGKEEKRIADGNTFGDIDETDLLLPECSIEDISLFYIANSYFNSYLYCFLPVSKKRLHSESLKDFPVYGQFSTNRNNSKYICIYQHNPYTPSPEIDLHALMSNPVLKAYVPEYDAYIYQDGLQMVWVIGKSFDRSVEIVFHLYTDRPDLLPAKRVQYKFDSRGFRVGDKNQCESIGKYLVFKKNIPTSYPVRNIKCGFFCKEHYFQTRHFTVNLPQE